MFRRVSIRLALLFGDGLLILFSLYLASWLRPQLDFAKPIQPAYAWLGWSIYGLALVVWGTVFLLMDVYNLQKNLRLTDELQRLILAHAGALLVFAGALYFSYRDISRLQVLTFAVIGLALLVAYRLVFRFMLHLFGDKRSGTRRVLIVGAGSVGRDAANMVIDHTWTGLRMIGFLDDNPQADTMGYAHLGPLDQALEVVLKHRITEVIFALPRDAHAKLTNLVVKLQAQKVNVRVVPDFFDLVFFRSAVEDFGGMPLVTLREPVLDPLQRVIKRSFDIIFASIGLVIALVPMSIIAIAIKLDSPGPVIFSQRRVGENGRLFNMYKFRTMVHNAEARQNELVKVINGQALYKFYDDPRVTRAGKFLRRTSLDELPQLVNILKGDMSLVGPRPELPWLVNQYEPWQRKRFEVPQGLTGWWQINGRADKPMHLNTADDLYYIKNYSLWLDIQIIWRTVKTVLDRRGSF